MHFYFYLREKIMIDDNIKKDNFLSLIHISEPTRLLSIADAVVSV